MSKPHHIAILAQIDGPIDVDDVALLETTARAVLGDVFGGRFKHVRVILPDAKPECAVLMDKGGKA